MTGPAGVDTVARAPVARAPRRAAAGAALAARAPSGPAAGVRSRSFQAPPASRKRTGRADSSTVKEPSALRHVRRVAVVWASRRVERAASKDPFGAGRARPGESSGRLAKSPAGTSG